MPVINDYEATAVCDCFGFYNRADRSASYPDCNGTYEKHEYRNSETMKPYDLW